MARISLACIDADEELYHVVVRHLKGFPIALKQHLRGELALSEFRGELAPLEICPGTGRRAKGGVAVGGRWGGVAEGARERERGTVEGEERESFRVFPQPSRWHAIRTCDVS